MHEYIALIIIRKAVGLSSPSNTPKIWIWSLAVPRGSGPTGANASEDSALSHVLIEPHGKVASSQIPTGLVDGLNYLAQGRP